MLIVYGVVRNPAVAAVQLYEAVGLLVPLAGGAVVYLFLRRELGPRSKEGCVDRAGRGAALMLPISGRLTDRAGGSRVVVVDA